MVELPLFTTSGFQVCSKNVRSVPSVNCASIRERSWRKSIGSRDSAESEDGRQAVDTAMSRGEGIVFGVFFLVIPWTSARHGLWRVRAEMSKHRYAAGRASSTDLIAVWTDRIFRVVAPLAGAALIAWAALR